MRKPSQNRLAHALRAARGAFGLAAMFSLFINLSMLVVPLYMMQIYDRVLTSQSLDTLILLTVLALGLLAVSMLVEIARSRVLVRIGTELDTSLSSSLFRSCLELRARGDDVSASQPLRDLESVRTFLTGPGVLALFDAPWSPLYLGLIFLLHPVLGGVALAGALVILFLALMSEAAVRAPLREAGVTGRWSNNLIESFARDGDTMRVLGMTETLRGRWQSYHDAGLAWQALASDRLAVLQATAKTVRFALQVAVLCTGAYLVLQHQLSAGVMVAASIIMARALAPIEAAIGQWRNFVNARAAHRRLRESMDTPQPDGDRVTLPSPRGRIEVEGVSMKPAGCLAPILFNVSFALQPGELLGIIGPSGAGKSTLARMLVGAQAPTTGTVRLDSANIADWPKDELGAYLGYLPQEVELLPGAIGQNICRFGEPDSRKIVAAAKLAGVHELILRLREGYETQVGEAGRLLSGGQRQRIGLARALYGDVRVIVLDEPNSNLDARGEEAVRRLLATLRARRLTGVLVAHRASLVASVDKLLVLNEGRVEMFGPRHEVLAAIAKKAAPQPPSREMRPNLNGSPARFPATL